MKILDEVINALEICGHDESPKCPYFDTEHWCCCEDHMRSISPLKDDALHYLKKYQWQMTNPDGDHLQLEKCRALLQDFYCNEPLSWDELRTMEGKPVFIDSIPLVRRWVVIKKFHPYGGNKNLFDMEVEDGAHFLRKNMRRDDPAWWQAYRKERTE